MEALEGDILNAYKTNITIQNNCKGANNRFWFIIKSFKKGSIGQKIMTKFCKLNIFIIKNTLCTLKRPINIYMHVYLDA